MAGSGRPEPVPAGELAAYLDALARRTLRHRRQPVLHLTGWHPLADSLAERPGGPTAADELAEALRSPLLLVRGGPTTSLRDALAELVAAHRTIRWRHWHRVLRLLGAEEEPAPAAGLPLAWLKFLSATGSALLVVAAAILQTVGPEWGQQWWWAVATSILLALVGAAATVADIRDAIVPRRLARPFRGRMDLAVWANQLRHDPSEVEQVVARAVLLDLIHEWRWRAAFAPRPIRGPYPVLFAPAALPGTRVLIEQYLAFASAPLLLVTDGSGPGPRAALGAVPLHHCPEWTVDATGEANPVRPGRRRRRPLRRLPPVLSWSYRRLVVRPLPRAALATALSVALVSAVAIGLTADDCQQSPPSHVVASLGERIGFQYCGETFLTDDPRSTLDNNPEQLIYTENAWVGEKVARESSTVVTILLLTSLTQGERPARGDAPYPPLAEREGLLGVYLAQHRINSLPDQHPLVRVAIGNTGERGEQAGVLANLVPRLLQHDPYVIGAAVTVNSREKVRVQLRRIGAAGIILASPTMSADEFGADLPGFLQLNPPHANSAQLALDYLATAVPGATVHTVLTPDPDDLYTDNLPKAMQQADPHGATVLVRPWADGRSNADLLATMCARPDRRQVAYFAGRYTDFASFITQLRTECGSDMPVLVADESISRFLFDPRLSSRLSHGTTVVVTMRGYLRTCASLRAAPAAGTPASVLGRRADFLDDMINVGRCLPAPGAAGPDLTGGWSMALYDTVRMIYDGFRRAWLRSPDLMTLDGESRRRRVFAILEQPHHAYPGVLEPVELDERRVTTSHSTLYCVPELSTALAPDATTILVAERGAGHTHIPTTPSPCGPAATAPTSEPTDSPTVSTTPGPTIGPAATPVNQIQPAR